MRGERLRTCMSSIILWRSGVMMDSSPCRDTWSISLWSAAYAPGATTRLRLVAFRRHVRVVFGKGLEAETAAATPTAKRFSSILVIQRRRSLPFRGLFKNLVECHVSAPNSIFTSAVL